MKTETMEFRRVSGGRLWIDGGNMFGIVPKPLWERKMPPDDKNRVLLETHCLLVRHRGRLILIDSGYGSKAPRRRREIYAFDKGNPILESLATIGVRPEDIDVVLLTHLHFDHVGGCTLRDNEGPFRPAFPRARYIVQRAEWDDATSGLPELSGAYFEQDFVPLMESKVLDLVEGDVELTPGFFARLTGGHTRGHQSILLDPEGAEPSLYLGDICPFVAHMRTLWSMAYDLYPLEVRRAKPKLLSEAAERNYMVFFAHDPKVTAARLSRAAMNEFVLRETYAF